MPDNLKKIVLQGLGTGFVTACLAWMSQGPPSTRVSTFTGALELIALVVLATLVFQNVDRAQRARIALPFGLAAGAVVGAATALRGVMNWSTPDPWMELIAFVMSAVMVLAVVYVVAWIAPARTRNILSRR